MEVLMDILKIINIILWIIIFTIVSGATLLGMVWRFEKQLLKMISILIAAVLCFFLSAPLAKPIGSLLSVPIMGILDKWSGLPVYATKFMTQTISVTASALIRPLLSVLLFFLLRFLFGIPMLILRIKDIRIFPTKLSLNRYLGMIPGFFTGVILTLMFFLPFSGPWGFFCETVKTSPTTSALIFGEPVVELTNTPSVLNTLYSCGDSFLFRTVSQSAKDSLQINIPEERDRILPALQFVTPFLEGSDPFSFLDDKELQPVLDSVKESPFFCSFTAYYIKAFGNALQNHTECFHYDPSESLDPSMPSESFYQACKTVSPEDIPSFLDTVSFLSPLLSNLMSDKEQFPDFLCDQEFVLSILNYLGNQELWFLIPDFINIGLNRFETKLGIGHNLSVDPEVYGKLTPEEKEKENEFLSSAISGLLSFARKMSSGESNSFSLSDLAQISVILSSARQSRLLKDVLPELANSFLDYLKSKLSVFSLVDNFPLPDIFPKLSDPLPDRYEQIREAGKKFAQSRDSAKEALHTLYESITDESSILAVSAFTDSLFSNCKLSPDTLDTVTYSLSKILSDLKKEKKEITQKDSDFLYDILTCISSGKLSTDDITPDKLISDFFSSPSVSSSLSAVVSSSNNKTIRDLSDFAEGISSEVVDELKNALDRFTDSLPDVRDSDTYRSFCSFFGIQ